MIGSSKPLRFGILGAARIAPLALVDPARTTGVAEVRAIAARSRPRAEEFAQMHEVPTVHDDHEAVIADPELDAIYVALPKHHAEWATKALERGNHVLGLRHGAMTLAMGLVCYSCGGGAMSQTEIESIVAETQAFAEAMNAGNSALAASFYTEDGVRVGGFGDRQRGRAEIEAAYDRLLQQTMPGARFHQERGTVRMLTPELAVWQGGIEISVPGSEEPIKGYVVQVMKKTGDRWLILEAHPKLFPPPPGQGR